MVKALLAAILVALVALIVLMLPATRPDRRFASVPAADGSTPSPSGFVVHNDAPPTLPSAAAIPQSAAPFVVTTAPPASSPSTAPTTPPSGTGSLDAVMQRLRSAKPDASVTVTPASPFAAAAPPAGPAPAAAASPFVTAAPVVTSAPTADSAPPPVSLPPPPIRWTNVTEQGVQFRIGRSTDGMVVSIDLGGSQVADVHVLPAFARLDQPAINARVDYLKQTILENFSTVSASYLFNRDGSVSRGR